RHPVASDARRVPPRPVRGHLGGGPRGRVRGGQPVAPALPLRTGRVHPVPEHLPVVRPARRAAAVAHRPRRTSPRPWDRPRARAECPPGIDEGWQDGQAVTPGRPLGDYRAAPPDPYPVPEGRAAPAGRPEGP